MARKTSTPNKAAAKATKTTAKPRRGKHGGVVIGSEVAGVSEIIERTKGTLKTLVERMVPRTDKEALKQAEQYGAGGCDLIQDIVETKLDFYPAGFGIRLKLTKNKKNPQRRMSDLIRKHQLRRICEELVRDYVTTDNMILQWKAKNGRLEYVTTLKPSRVEYDDSPGIETLKVEISEKIIKKISDAIYGGTKEQRAEVRRHFPEKIIEAVRKGDRYYKLANADGEYWVVHTRARRFSGLARPSMYSRFGDIVLRELMISGDWSVAYYLKRVIEHVKAGEKAPANTHDPRELYPEDADLDGIHKQFQDALGHVLRLVTNHTVSVEYPHPDPKIFDTMKYEKVEERILRWGAVVDVLMTGKGEGFSQGHLGASRFKAQGNRVRESVASVFEAFVLHDSMRGALKINEDSAIEVTFDQQNLKDPNLVLESLNSGYDRGLVSNPSYIEQIGLDPETERQRKEQDHKEKNIWAPTFEPRQGMLSEQQPGRPAGNQEVKKTARRRPRPGQTGVTNG